MGILKTSLTTGLVVRTTGLYLSYGARLVDGEYGRLHLLGVLLMEGAKTVGRGQYGTYYRYLRTMVGTKAIVWVSTGKYLDVLYWIGRGHHDSVGKSVLEVCEHGLRGRKGARFL